MEQTNGNSAAIVVDSVTHLVQADGRPAVAGSHGGIYSAAYGAAHGVTALILNDAGVGRDDAGIAGLRYLDGYGIPAAAVSYLSCRIGDGGDMLRRGTISFANDPARALGCVPGLSCREAAERLRAAKPPARRPPEPLEARRLIAPGPPAIFALDSNSLVTADDRDAIVVTGSHGGLLGGRPETALKFDTRGALYNDAGIGCDDAGISRLPALAARGIPAATVSASSARIGDGRSTYDDGIVSALNEPARALGGAIGMTARELVARIAAG